MTKTEIKKGRPRLREPYDPKERVKVTCPTCGKIREVCKHTSIQFPNRGCFQCGSKSRRPKNYRQTKKAVPNTAEIKEKYASGEYLVRELAAEYQMEEWDVLAIINGQRL